MEPPELLSAILLLPARRATRALAEFARAIDLGELADLRDIG